MNNINRYNYDTYFLLYVDNELSAVEKNSVDEFVQSNPDLGEELVMLLQTISQKEGILLNNKMSLYKKEPLLSELQEKLLLHLDNELNEVEIKEVAALIRSSKLVSVEWDKVQSAKFSPNSAVVYEDKKSLYRSEKGRLVFLPWRKLLAAAILVGVGLWGGLVYLNFSSNISNQSKPGIENKLIVGEIKKNSSSYTKQIKKLASQQPKIKTSTRSSSFPKDVSNFLVSKIEKTIIPSSESITDEIPNLNNSHTRLVGLINMVNNEGESNSMSIDGEMLEKQLVERSKELGLKLVDDQQIIEQTLLTNNSNIVDSSENNNQIFLIGEEKLKRIMSGGFFAKVKKSLERRSLNQNILNSIKVANFEITIR
jgi:hypothetical protein